MRKIVCIGDSLTEAAELDRNDTWPILLEKALNLKIINKGIGGDTSSGLLGRFYPDVVPHEPDIVIILCGTNDLWWDLDVNLIQANIFAMACQAQFHNISPIVGLPLPLLMGNIRSQEMMPPVAGWEKCVSQLAALVKALASSAHQSDIASLDFHHLFLDGNGTALGEYYLEDGLHPNNRGHWLMAEATAKLLHDRFHFQYK